MQNKEQICTAQQRPLQIAKDQSEPTGGSPQQQASTGQHRQLGTAQHDKQHQ